MRQHEQADQSIVELATASARLVVTASHRVLIPERDSVTFLLAGELARGDRVVLDGRQTEALEVVHHFEVRTEVFEFHFKPDEPVAAFHAADAETLQPHQILSMGRRRHTHRGGRTGTARRSQAQRGSEDQVAAMAASGPALDAPGGV